MDRDVFVYALSKAFYMKPAIVRYLVDNIENLSGLFELREKDLIDLFNGDREVALNLLNPSLLEDANNDLEWAKRKGVKILLMGDNEYPKLLMECDDAPMVLFYIGTADLNNYFPVSIVGTRMASAYGREACRGLVSSVSMDNVMIVSGMAYGVDICAHKAALEYGIPTIGVLPCGIDTIYPHPHRDIAKKMVENGGILTEFSPGSGVRKWHFLKRNRIIAGMSKALVVVESRMTGGAMRTAEYANSYSRDVYAMPGRLCDTNSAGCNYLISRNMAQICTYSSFREMCGLDKAGNTHIGGSENLFLFDNDKKEKILLSLNDNSMQDADALCETTGFTFDELAPLLLELELEGKVVSDDLCRYKVR